MATLTSRLAPRRPAAAAALSLLLVAAHASHPFAGGRVAGCGVAGSVPGPGRAISNFVKCLGSSPRIHVSA